MTGIIKSFLAILLLSFITKGLRACSLDTFTVGNVQTGRITQGKPEWKVSVIDDCACAQSDIKLKCTGFQSTEAADPLMFAKQGHRCLLNSGKALAPHGTVSFSYAWDPRFLLWPAESVSAGC